MLELLSYQNMITEHAEYTNFLVVGILLQLLFYACQTGVSEITAEMLSHQKRTQQFRDVIRFVEENYKEPLKQSDIAEHFHISKNYFSKYFKRCSGVTFTDYVTRYRLNKARQDLAISDASILEISLCCGFPDVSRFIHEFKKIYGMTPLQFRKSLQKKE